MGGLELYHIDWSEPSNPSLSFVAVLELPIVHSVPPPPDGSMSFLSMPGRPSFDLSGMPSVARTSHPQFCNPQAAVIDCHCHFSPEFQSVQPASYARGPPRIFEPAKSSQLLRVRISLPSPETATTTDRARSPSPRDTSLYIPLQVIFDTIKSAQAGASRRSGIKRIQWEQWAADTRWVHLPLIFGTTRFARLRVRGAC
jgi:hypothetical protein